MSLEIDVGLLYIIVVVVLCLLLVFSFSICKWIKIIGSRTEPIEIRLEQMEPPRGRRRYGRSLRRELFGQRIRIRRYAAQRYRLINNSLSTLQEIHNSGIEARTDTTVCCICLEDFNFLRDANSLFSGSSRGELKYSELNIMSTTTKGHTKSGAPDLTVKSSRGLRDDFQGKFVCKDDGFRNRRSFTINSRDDIKGVHQLSNKRKLSITLETTNNNVLSSAKRNEKQRKCPTIKKYLPDDLYSCVFEQQIENNSNNETVIQIENNSEEVSYMQLRNNRNDVPIDIHRDANVVSSVVENYYYPEMMLYADINLVNIPGSVNTDSSSTSTYSSETDLDNKDCDGERQDDLRTILGLLPCGHVFHFECIFEWLKKSKNCPTCRQNGTMYNVKVVKRDAFQKYMRLSQFREAPANVSDSDRRKLLKTCYRRSISALC